MLKDCSESIGEVVLDKSQKGQASLMLCPFDAFTSAATLACKTSCIKSGFLLKAL